MRQNEGVEGDGKARKVSPKTEQRLKFIRAAAKDPSLPECNHLLLPDRVQQFARDALQIMSRRTAKVNSKAYLRKTQLRFSR